MINGVLINFSQSVRGYQVITLLLLSLCLTPVFVSQAASHGSIRYAQAAFQTYIVEFNLVEISEQDFAQLSDESKTALIDKLIQQIEKDTQLQIEIRIRYQFVPSVVIYIDDAGLQILEKHSAVKSISPNSRLKAI